jgi:hypothetical protein
MKTIHTHRGHCQKCLRVHAIDVHTGLVAKHGYTVDGGYFNGECYGSGELSLHVSRELTDRIIVLCAEDDAAYTKRAEALKAGTITPETARNGETRKVVKQTRRGSYNTYEDVMVPFAEAPANYQRDAVRIAVHAAENIARQARDHRKMMIEWAAKIYDAKVPAYRNEDLESGLKVGDVVRIGGKTKKGFDATVEAIEDRDYQTFGYRRGRQTISIPHARITRPATTAKVMNYDTMKMEVKTTPATTYWEAVRSIKKPEGTMVDILKKAGLID